MQPPARTNGEDKMNNGDDRDYVHGYPDHGGYSYPDHSNVSPAVKGSPSHHPGSGRATPRGVKSQQPQWDGYNSHQRPLPSSNLSYVMGDSRSTNGYASTASYSTNPTPSSKKRGRDADDDDDNAVADASVLKRRKHAQEGSAGLANSINPPRTGLVQ